MMPRSPEMRRTAPGATLRKYYDKLIRAFGPQGWWPARTRLEVILGAILVQNTSWQSAALALKNLRGAGLLNLSSLGKLRLDELESLVHPAGFFRQKARTIRNVLEWLRTAHGGSLNALFASPSAELRGELLKIKGLGPETVDAILLYAGRKPFFVADAYARRILSRHELVSPRVGYAQVQDFIHRHLPPDQALYNEFHALLVEVGKRYCKRETPHCESCPLEEFLPPAEPARSLLLMKRWRESERREGAPAL